MKITRQLNVSASDFFSLIEESLIYEIKTYTKEENPIISEGYSYKREMSNKLGGKGTVSVTVEKYEKPTFYKSKIYSKQGFNYITYTITEISQDEIELTYEEDFISDKKLNNLNYKIMSKIMKKSMEKRANMIISSMERHLLDQKRNEDQECQD